MTVDERISRDLKQHLPDVDESGVWPYIETEAIAARRRRTAFIAMTSVVAATVAVFLWINFPFVDESLPVRSNPAQEKVPAWRIEIIREVVDAINGRDADGFIEAFSPQGSFNPRGDFHPALMDNFLSVEDEGRVGAWMTIVDAWGLETELKICDAKDRVPGGWGRFAGEQTIECEVATRWHTLSIEVVERWTFQFAQNGLLDLTHRLVDLEPDDRTLQFGYDLIEEWEAWLEATHPLAAKRYLNHRTWEDIFDACDGCQEHQDSLAPGDPELAAQLAALMYGTEKTWKVGEYTWHPIGLIPYDPNLADEIEASINEYLETK
jgi:hypothetical protein